MSTFRVSSGFLCVLMLTGTASARWSAVACLTVGFQGGHGHHGSSGGSGAPAGHPGGGAFFPGAGQVINYRPPTFINYGFGGASYYTPTFFVLGQGGGFVPPLTAPSWPIFPTQGGGGPGGLMLPMPAAGSGQANAAAPRRPNPARARELVELGDRSFRGGNTRRADDRYQQAVKADPASPLPHVHLAQVSIVRGDYEAAARHLRAAVVAGAGSGWLVNAPDIQAVFSEPGDFARQLAKLETHLQANPTDRDGWFVLGAEWFLSGRTVQSADVFQRLSDRRPDDALAAFTDASKPK